MENTFIPIEKKLKKNTFKKNDKNKLYRIIKIEDFFTMMKKKSLIFKRLKLWDDIYHYYCYCLKHDTKKFNWYL